MARAGSLYDLLTLRVAYGVSLYGEATEEYTWFPGYAWTLAYCRDCSAHLVRACCCAVLCRVLGFRDCGLWLCLDARLSVGGVLPRLLGAPGARLLL